MASTIARRVEALGMDVFAPPDFMARVSGIRYAPLLLDRHRRASNEVFEALWSAMEPCNHQGFTLGDVWRDC
jgi:hypothetical protein